MIATCPERRSFSNLSSRHAKQNLSRSRPQKQVSFMDPSSQPFGNAVGRDSRDLN